jgi:transposase
MRTDCVDRFAYMVEHIVDASNRRSHIDIRVGVGRRRRWSDEDKGRIVAESYAPGAVVSEVARRHEVTPQHLFVWRKAARAGRLALPAEAAALFVPVVVAPEKTAVAKPAAALITIEIAGVVVRVERGVDVGWLVDVLRAVRAAT